MTLEQTGNKGHAQGTNAKKYTQEAQVSALGFCADVGNQGIGGTINDPCTKAKNKNGNS